MKPGRPPKYPWRTMEVGETFLVPRKKTQSLKGCIFHLKPERRFRFRQVMTGGVPCVRVWRIA